MKHLKSIIFLSFFVLLIGCDSSVSIKEYHANLENESFGLINSKTINGLILTVKVLPAELLSYNEFAKDKFNKDNPDTIFSEYNSGVCFLLNIKPDPSVRPDQEALLIGLKSLKEFDDRVHALNFELEKFITLKFDGKIEKPVLSVLGNSFGLTASKSVVVTFLNKDNYENLVFEFKDPFFKTGHTKFSFSKSDFENFPHLKEWLELKNRTH